jgi:hypothetical protein
MCASRGTNEHSLLLQKDDEGLDISTQAIKNINSYYFVDASNDASYEENNTFPLFDQNTYKYSGTAILDIMNHVISFLPHHNDVAALENTSQFVYQLIDQTLYGQNARKAKELEPYYVRKFFADSAVTHASITCIATSATIGGCASGTALCGKVICPACFPNVSILTKWFLGAAVCSVSGGLPTAGIALSLFTLFSNKNKQYVNDRAIKQKEIREGCSVFLMSNPNDGIHEISNEDCLYLYVGDDQKIFYHIPENTQKYYLEEENLPLLQLLQDQQLFTSTKDDLTKYDNNEIIKPILTITSGRGHTFGDKLLKPKRENEMRPH